MDHGPLRVSTNLPDEELGKSNSEGMASKKFLGIAFQNPNQVVGPDARRGVKSGVWAYGQMRAWGFSPENPGDEAAVETLLPDKLCLLPEE